MSLRTSWLPLALLGFAAPAPAVTIDWVAVGNPGNAPDAAVNCDGAADCGSVPYTFVISRTEVTNAQYAEFLNAVAASDPNGLYDPAMGSSGRGGITRSGSDGSYSYAIRPGAGNKPVVFVSFPDAMRFANWLDNGQPSGAQGPATTEDGSYAITPGGLAANSITRKPGTGVVVPNENEWYKAAYHSPGGVYFDFPTGSDAAPSSDPPPGGAGSANFFDLTGGYAVTGSTQFVDSFDYLTDAGAYASASSPYGTFDQGGNAVEWTETIVDGGGFRRARGGSWGFPVTNLAASAGTLAEAPDSADDELGFRVAVSVPEPGSTSAALAALLALGAGAAARRRRRAP
ncbi:MAG: SUMF1/EgtB/PvdO family nonheme iron enzyme [Deltaproteobacteria bacterium]|nr:SUMF1/EgtB/PvdO family nonheme iron enzyme [Deltaproteobacteria bacterium]